MATRMVSGLPTNLLRALLLLTFLGVQALDLGLNRNPDKWMHNGRELFTEKEKSIRKRIWWSCCLADKFSALFLGRTIGIHEGDFSTPLLDIPAVCVSPLPSDENADFDVYLCTGRRG